MGGTESMLGEWVFGLPGWIARGEPIIMATRRGARRLPHGGHRLRGLAHRRRVPALDPGRLRRRRACDHRARCPIPQVEAEKQRGDGALAADEPDAIVHVGFGLGLVGMNDALEEIGWMPPRYTTTAFEFAATTPWWRQQLAGWIGLDQYDERNQTAQAFLDRFEARTGAGPSTSSRSTATTSGG